MGNVGNWGRVLYVEPNDVFEKVDGVPMTPDYSDMCISFDLTVEIVRRFKDNTNFNENSTATWIISWVNVDHLDENNTTTHGWVSFLKGTDGYLTTYYTDTSYKDVLQQNIVEGLGVDSVTISFESYYTPTVTIKFVDERGSSLFGREEIAHGDNTNGIDSVFGAFFTAPYPKFKLQVKGFFGKAVTYQLTCSGFKGNLNSQTGNFEATATFIAYSYSLLTDIPFQYIVAAPYCSYEGSTYWLSKVRSNEWKMFPDGTTMQTLHEFVTKLDSCFKDESLLNVNQTDVSDTLSTSMTFLNDIIRLTTSAFITDIFEIGEGRQFNVFENITGSNTIIPKAQPNEPHIVVWVSNKEIINFPERNKEYLKSAINEIKRFNSSDKRISYPLGIGDENQLPTTIEGIKVFDNDSEYKLVFSYNGKNEFDFGEIKFYDTNGQLVSIGGLIANAILSAAESGKLGKEYKYIYIFNIGDTIKNCETYKTTIQNQLNNLHLQKERDYISLAKSKLGFVPYIGNVFKMIMCHVETLVHIMYTCFDNILSQSLSGSRSPESLGIRNSDISTDVELGDDSRPNVIPPWPLVSSNVTRGSFRGASHFEKNDTIGWVDDISSNFEEAKVVKSMFLACKRIQNDNGQPQITIPINIQYLPASPSDLNNLQMPFRTPDRNNREGDIAAMLGIRMAQIFGIMDSDASNNVAKLLGEIDGYNLFASIGDKSEIDKILRTFNGSSNNEVVNNGVIVTNILKVLKSEKDGSIQKIEENNGNQRFAYELRQLDKVNNELVNKQNPLYVEKSEKLYFTYLFDNGFHGLVPSKILEWSKYKNLFVNNLGHPFCSKIISSGNRYYTDDVLYNGNIEQFISNNDNTARATKENILNEDMFNILDRDSFVTGIITKYKQIKENKAGVGGLTYIMSNMEELLERYWKVESDNYLNYVSPLFFDKINTVDEEGKYKSTQLREITESPYKAINEEDINKFYDGGSIDKNFVRHISVKESGKSISLFGSQLYIQNMKGNTEDSKKVRSLLLLYAIANVKPNNFPNFLNNNFKHGSIESVSKAYIYLLGGILWLSRNTNKIITDGYSLGDLSHHTLFVSSNNKYEFTFKKNKVDKVSYVSIAQLFGGKLPDYNVQNSLIDKFLDFYNNCYRNILYNLELYSRDYNIDTLLNAFNFFKRGNDAVNNGDTTTSGNTTTTTLEANLNMSGTKKFEEIYYTFYYEEGMSGVQLFLTDENPAQSYLYDLITKQCIIVDNSQKKDSSQVNELTDVSFKTEKAEYYINGIITALENIKKENNEATSNSSRVNFDVDISDEDMKEFNRDVAIPIYLYLKMLWDKWLCDTRNRDIFDVDKFYKNFVFIDSFYRNIEHRFMVNCQVFLDCYDNNAFSNRDITLFKFLGDITTNHHCLFVAVPDFISGLASGGSDSSFRSRRDSIKALEDLFKPVPYRDKDKPQEYNKFCIIYVPKLSETPTSMNGFREDWFNIWSYNSVVDNKGGQQNTRPIETTRSNTAGEIAYTSSIPENAPRILMDVNALFEENNSALPTSNNGTETETSAQVINEGQNLTEISDVSRYGYTVPAFGLVYGYQNNHLFKNIQLNMETPIITSSVINTLSHIASKGASSAHRIAYVGQDTYPVFSNYSYICEFDMMGNAQIQPLMYFQLTNVPMWRGTYMIFNVTHTMKPGDMTTHVKAMKLSNRAVPYSNAWYTKNLNYRPDPVDAIVDCLDQISNGNIVSTNTFTPANDDNNQTETGDGGGYTFTDTNTNSQDKYPNLGDKVDLDNVILSQNDKITTIYISLVGSDKPDDYGSREYYRHYKDTDASLHFVIKRNGDVEVCKSTAFGNNEGERISVGFVVELNKINQKNTNDIRTKQQIDSSIRLITALKNAYNIKKIIAYVYDLFDVEKEYGSIINQPIQSTVASNANSSSNSLPAPSGKVSFEEVQKRVKTITEIEKNGGKVQFNKDLLTRYIDFIHIGYPHDYTIKGNWYYVRGVTPIQGLSECGEHKCTYGVSTWYYLAGGSGYDFTFWRTGNVNIHIVGCKDKLNVIQKWSSFDEANKYLNVPGNVEVGDILTYHHNGTKHGCMWTGKDWRSDFVQKRWWVYGTKTVEGEIWLHRLKDS